jgi:fructokinase
MSEAPGLTIFGEVLFDCFPSGEQVLGGAPFNVAWHAQALGDRPRLISRVGADELGEKILAAMHVWGMDTAGIQIDPDHPTGRVAVRIEGNEPSYHIQPDCAYDFIAAESLGQRPSGGILYHGTLGLRNRTSRTAFDRLAQNPDLAIFLDVNLRSPWWQKEEVFGWLERARWVKLNQDELRLLGFAAADLRQAMARLQTQFQLEQIILTRGEQGGLVRTCGGAYHQVAAETAQPIVDTVGAGDAFTAIYLHGLLTGWPVTETLAAAQRFAGKIVGLRGATTTDAAFYQDFIRSAGTCFC